MRFIAISSEPNYEISKEGIIRVINTKKIKSQYVSSTGYYIISISHNNKSKPHRVHRLLAETFLKNPQNKPEINHKDGNKLNNNISNLEYCTHAENMKHAFKNGLVNNTGIKNGRAKLNNNKVRKIRAMLKDGISQQKIANEFQISRGAILKINLGKTWKHI